jgi:amino acid transporter
VYGFMGSAVGDTVAFYGGPDIPWPVYALVMIAIVAVLGYRHIELSARGLGVALVCEVGIVLLLDLFILGTSPVGGRSERGSA